MTDSTAFVTSSAPLHDMEVVPDSNPKLLQPNGDFFPTRRGSGTLTNRNKSNSNKDRRRKKERKKQLHNMRLTIDNKSPTRHPYSNRTSMSDNKREPSRLLGTTGPCTCRTKSHNRAITKSHNQAIDAPLKSHSQIDTQWHNRATIGTPEQDRENSKEITRRERRRERKQNRKNPPNMHINDNVEAPQRQNAQAASQKQDKQQKTDRNTSQREEHTNTTDRRNNKQKRTAQHDRDTNNYHKQHHRHITKTKQTTEDREKHITERRDWIPHFQSPF
jgi:hypothetical protein